jgi:VanZ family protein
MGLIYWLGTGRGDAEATGSLLGLLLKTLAPSLYARISPHDLALMNLAFRKCGHFFGYGLLGVLNARAFLGVRGSLGRREVLAAWSATVLWACVDEVHQSFFSTRGASPADVLLDGVGAATCIGLYLLWNERRKGRH